MVRRAKGTRLYNVDDAADICGVKPATVREWLKNGSMRGLKKKYGHGHRLRWIIKGTEVNRVLREIAGA